MFKGVALAGASLLLTACVAGPNQLLGSQQITPPTRTSDEPQMCSRAIVYSETTGALTLPTGSVGKTLSLGGGGANLSANVLQQATQMAQALDSDQYFWCITMSNLPKGDTADLMAIAKMNHDEILAMTNIFLAGQTNDPAKIQQAVTAGAPVVAASKQLPSADAAAPASTALAAAAAAKDVPSAPAAPAAKQAAKDAGISQKTITAVANDAVHTIAADLATRTATPN